MVTRILHNLERLALALMVFELVLILLVWDWLGAIFWEGEA